MTKDKKAPEQEIDETLENPVADSDEILDEEATDDMAGQPLLEDVLADNKKLKEDYLRAFAEAENVKKRCQQEIDKNNKFAVASFAKNLLSVADNLQRAIDAAAAETDDESCKALLKGVELTQNELTKVFDKFDVHKMEIMDTVFDPNFHQVIQEVEDKSKPAGTIIAEIQTGYMIHDRILREAMVVVTK